MQPLIISKRTEHHSRILAFRIARLLCHRLSSNPASGINLIEGDFPEQAHLQIQKGVEDDINYYCIVSLDAVERYCYEATYTVSMNFGDIVIVRILLRGENTIQSIKTLNGEVFLLDRIELE